MVMPVDKSSTTTPSSINILWKRFHYLVLFSCGPPSLFFIRLFDIHRNTSVTRRRETDARRLLFTWWYLQFKSCWEGANTVEGKKGKIGLMSISKAFLYWRKCSVGRIPSSGWPNHFSRTSSSVFIRGGELCDILWNWTCRLKLKQLEKCLQWGYGYLYYAWLL